MIRENLTHAFKLYDRELPSPYAGKTVVEQYRHMVKQKSLKFPRGYVPEDGDNFCSMFVSLDLMELGHPELIECGAQKMADRFEKAGLLYDELPDDVDLNKDVVVCFFDWQCNNGWIDHVGWMLDEDEGIVTTLEGNTNKIIDKRLRHHKYIKMYGILRDVKRE